MADGGQYACVDSDYIIKRCNYDGVSMASDGLCLCDGCSLAVRRHRPASGSLSQWLAALPFVGAARVSFGPVRDMPERVNGS